MPIERFIWTEHAEERLAPAKTAPILTRNIDHHYPQTMSARYAYYDRDADIAWLPTGYSENVLSEEVSWGLVDHDAATDEVVALEVWNASKRLPSAVLDALPAPTAPHSAAV